MHARDVAGDQFGSVLAYVTGDTLPSDLNDGSLAFRSVPDRSDTISVSSEQDSILVEAEVSFANELALDRTAELVLPPGKGYTTVTSLTRKLDSLQISFNLSWYIKAPNSAVPADNIQLIVSAASRTNPDVVQTLTRTISIRTVTKARLDLTASIVDPKGAIDDTLSAGQEFTLEARIAKTGTAGIEGTGVITLEPGSFTLSGSNASQNYSGGDSIRWVLQVPDGMEPGVNDMRITLDSTSKPIDVNTRRSAATVTDTIDYAVTIELAGEVNILSYTISTNRDTLSTGQVFQYTVLFEPNENAIDVAAKITYPQNIFTIATLD